MLIASLLRVVTRVVGCGAIVLGALILQGCGDDEGAASAASSESTSEAKSGVGALDPEAVRVAQEAIYKKLDEAFPEGKPAISSPEERSQDQAYMAQLAEAQKVTARLQAALQKAQAEADRFKEIILEELRRENGVEPNPVIVAVRLAQEDHYQKLLAVVTAAQAAVDENQQANVRLIAERQNLPITKYEALKAAADAEATAAGIPVRVVVRPNAGSQEVVQEESEPKAVPTVEELSKETGIPLAPKQP